MDSKDIWRFKWSFTVVIAVAAIYAMIVISYVSTVEGRIMRRLSEIEAKLPAGVRIGESDVSR